MDEANSYVYNFKSNTCYSLKGVGGTQILCVTFNTNYKPTIATEYPQIQYNVNSKTFSISSSGKNCTLKISSKICCIYQADTKDKK